jgi:hypothetical protein
LQDEINAAERSQVRLMVVTDNSVAEPNYATLIRTLIVVAGGGLAVTLLLAVAIDTAVRRRRTGAEVPSTQPVNVPPATAATQAASPLPPMAGRPSPPLVDQFLDGRTGNSGPGSKRTRPERKPG